MDKDLFVQCNAISVFANEADILEPLIKLVGGMVANVPSACATVFRLVVGSKCTTLAEFIAKLIFRSDNPFARACARGEKIEEFMQERVKSELATFAELAMVDIDEYVQDYGVSFGLKSGDFVLTYDTVAEHYNKHGFSVWECGDAFLFRGGKLVPQASGSASFDALVGYDSEKEELINNTANFLADKPCFDVLLYGDRGTGKSTSVRALANKFKDTALKIVQIDKRDLHLLYDVFDMIEVSGRKVVLFIDDLTFDEDDADFDAFKAALDGGFARPKNVVFYATTNRRHLVKESDTAHPDSDEAQQRLSLFDRFGIVITYLGTGKTEYLEIFRSILTSFGIKWKEEYGMKAECEALKKGGRSPRVARQVAEMIAAGLGKKV